jgi:hypothetical protein
MPFTSRPLAHLANDLEGVHERCAELSVTLTGMSILFGGVGALTALGGLWTREPMFAMSALFALTASVAFGLSAQSLSRAAASTPRIRTAPVTVPAKSWRRAA